MGKFKLIVQSCEWHIFVHSKFLRRANSCMCLLMICAFLQTVHSCKKVNLSIKGGIVLGTTGKYMPFCNDAPQAQAKDLLSKENIHGSPLVSRRERGRGTLNSSLYKLPSSFLAANRSPLNGQQICQRLCLHLLLPTTPPPLLSNYHVEMSLIVGPQPFDLQVWIVGFEGIFLLKSGLEYLFRATETLFLLLKKMKIINTLLTSTILLHISLTLLLVLPPPPLRQVAAGLCQAGPRVHHLRPLRQHRLRLSLKLRNPLGIRSIQTRIPEKRNRYTRIPPKSESLCP